MNTNTTIVSPDDLIWEEPPASRYGRGPNRWAPVMDALRANPGEWANLGEHKVELAQNIKSGRTAGTERGEFEAVARNMDDATRRGTIYARYVGGQR